MYMYEGGFPGSLWSCLRLLPFVHLVLPMQLWAVSFEVVWGTAHLKQPAGFRLLLGEGKIL